jgi:2-keto-4-pentenoate hydratase/2-oxohepta-3-ene-1,7-dioic acid hydratase in catechol pathway
LRTTAIALIALVLAFVGFSFYVSQPVVEGMRGNFEPVIAERADALTFARAAEGLILVTRHEGDAVVGVNLTKQFGEAATADLIAFVSNLKQANLPDANAITERFLLAELVMPLLYTYPSVAAGTNFKEHAEEVYSDDPPFLFPKLAVAGNWNEGVPFLPRLDFEAELCMFPLLDIDIDIDSDIDSYIDKASALPEFGLVLCNDFTDRWTLLSELELGQPLGLTGFAAGKGCENCFPTGYLVVIPKKSEFYLSLEISLYVNDELKQQFNMRDLILPIEDIVVEAFKNKNTDYLNGDHPLSLLPHGSIPKSTLILTGTAAGVLFKPVNIWNQRFYLQPGDTVRTEATYLGHLENEVEGH